MPNVSLVEYAAQMESENPAISGVVQVLTNNSVFMRRLRFVQALDFGYTYSRQQTLGTIAFRGINESFTPDVGVINPQTEQLKIFGGTIKTDRQLAKGPRGTAYRVNNIAAKVKRAGLNFDRQVIKGDSQTDPKGFDGLNTRLTGGQLITISANGGMLTLAKLDAAIDKCVGVNSQKIIVCNKAVRRQISDLIIAAAGGAAVADVKTDQLNYKGCQVEVIDEDGDSTAILAFNETQGNSNVCTSLYVINVGGDVDEENFRGLVREVDGTMIEQVAYGERSGFVEDLVEAVFGIACFHGRAAVRLAGVKES